MTIDLEKPAAFIAVSYTQIINIFDIEHGIEDYVVFQWNTSGTLDRERRSRVRHNADGEAYFMSHGQRYYFRDAIRIRYL